MGFVVHGEKSLNAHGGVALSRREILMAEERLDFSQVGTAGEEVRCERVPQLVRRYVAAEDPQGGAIYDARERAHRDGPGTTAGEKGGSSARWARVSVGR